MLLNFSNSIVFFCLDVIAVEIFILFCFVDVGIWCVNVLIEQFYCWGLVEAGVILLRSAGEIGQLTLIPPHCGFLIPRRQILFCTFC